MSCGERFGRGGKRCLGEVERDLSEGGDRVLS